MIFTKSSYAVFKSVQSIWIFWQDLMRVWSNNHHEICYFILTRLQILHFMINKSQNTTSRQIESSLWKFIDSEYFMWACQSTLSSVNNKQNVQKIFQHIWLVASTLKSLISFSICCLTVSFKVSIIEQLLLQNRILLIVFQ